MKNINLPNNAEAEYSLLGCVLFEDGQGSVSEDVFLKIKKTDFYFDHNKKVFAAMQALFKKTVPVDLVTLSEVLEKKNQLEKIGGLDLLTKIAGSVPSNANYNHYLKIVKNNSLQRQYITKINDLMNEATSTSFETIKTKTEALLNKLDESIINSDYEGMSEIATKELEIIEKKISGEYKEKAISTGFPLLDSALKYLKGGQLIGLGARPGVGKTTFALQIASFAALQLHQKTLFFSLEQTKSELFKKLISLNGNLKSDVFESQGSLSTNLKTIKETSKKLTKSKLFIDDEFNTMDSIILKSKKMNRKEGINLIVVDYLQIIPTSSNSFEKRIQIGDFSVKLKRLAKELDIPIIILSQLNRDVDGRIPKLGDFKESGEIEANLDVALALYEPIEAEEESPEETSVIALILKNRAGIKNLGLNYKLKGAYSRFSEVNNKKNNGKAQLNEIKGPAKFDADKMPF